MKFHPEQNESRRAVQVIVKKLSSAQDVHEARGQVRIAADTW